jgi:MOSC domain-containing protein YiiM
MVRLKKPPSGLLDLGIVGWNPKIMTQLLSIQVGVALRIKIGERNILTAHSKQGVTGAVSVLPLGLLGDEQADLSVHGGLEKAVYAYPSEHYAYWRAARLDAGLGQIDDRLPHGSLGENLTLKGLLETGIWAGDVLKFPGCELRVTLPREPCYKFNAVMGFGSASKLMAQSGFCGFYLAVQSPGMLRAGDAFEVIAGRRSVSIPALFAVKMRKHLR